MIKQRKLWVLLVPVILALVFGGIVWVVLFMTDRKRTDLREISPLVDSYRARYISERGFGNNRFDIYEFTVKEPNSSAIEPAFILADQRFTEVYTASFRPFLEKRPNLPDKLREAAMDIFDIALEQDLRYKLVEQGGTQKLYMFSQKRNQGYCLILTI